MGSPAIRNQWPPNCIFATGNVVLTVGVSFKSVSCQGIVEVCRRVLFSRLSQCHVTAFFDMNSYLDRDRGLVVEPVFELCEIGLEQLRWMIWKEDGDCSVRSS